MSDAEIDGRTFMREERRAQVLAVRESRDERAAEEERNDKRKDRNERLITSGILSVIVLVFGSLLVIMLMELSKAAWIGLGLSIAGILVIWAGIYGVMKARAD